MSETDIMVRQNPVLEHSHNFVTAFVEGKRKTIIELCEHLKLCFVLILGESAVIRTSTELHLIINMAEI